MGWGGRTELRVEARVQTARSGASHLVPGRKGKNRTRPYKVEGKPSWLRHVKGGLTNKERLKTRSRSGFFITGGGKEDIPCNVITRRKCNGEAQDNKRGPRPRKTSSEIGEEKEARPATLKDAAKKGGGAGGRIIETIQEETEKLGSNGRAWLSF